MVLRVYKLVLASFLAASAFCLSYYSIDLEVLLQDYGLDRGICSTSECRTKIKRLPVCSELRMFEVIFHHRPNMLLNGTFFNTWEKKFIKLLKLRKLDDLLELFNCSPDVLDELLYDNIPDMHRLQCIFVNYVILVDKLYKGA